METESLAHLLAAVAGLDGVPEAVAEAREACERLRWHRGLRRGWEVARVEAGVRCAREGLALDGLRFPTDLVRDVARGAEPPPAGPAGEALRGAVRVQSEVVLGMPAPGAATPARVVPVGQLLARLHATVVGDVPGAGRVRTGSVGPASRVGELPSGLVEERPAGSPSDRSGGHGELRGLGPAPDGPELHARVALLRELLDARPPRDVSAVVLAAVVLGEMLVVRPFAEGNAAVGRALVRHVLTRDGVDPVGVVVPEVLWRARPNVHLATAAQYATGTPQGVAAWVGHCAAAVVAGAQEGTRIADAVLAGRLGG